MAEAITEMIIPGTYIEVRAEGLIGVSGIVTGNVGVVGTAAKGPIGTPVVLSSFSEARETFGGYDAWAGGAKNELTLVRALQHVFGNGAGTVYAVRVASGAAAAAKRALSTTTAGATPTTAVAVTLAAKTTGTWGNAITVEVKDATANAWVQENRQPVAAGTGTPAAAVVKALHAKIADSPRNTVSVEKKATGQTKRYHLAVGPTAADGVPAVSDTGALTFHTNDAPAAGDEIVASYEVLAAASRDVEIAYGNAKETYTIADAGDLAADVAASSVLVDAALVAAQAASLPNKSSVAALEDGNDGQA